MFRLKINILQFKFEYKFKFDQTSPINKYILNPLIPVNRFKTSVMFKSDQQK